MIIQLNERYRITSQARNFVLEEFKTNKKNGKEYWVDVGYYAELEHVLLKLFKLGLQESEVEGIQSIINEIKTSVKSIMEQIELLEDESKANDYGE